MPKVDQAAGGDFTGDPLAFMRNNLVITNEAGDSYQNGPHRVGFVLSTGALSDTTRARGNVYNLRTSKTYFNDKATEGFDAYIEATLWRAVYLGWRRLTIGADYGPLRNLSLTRAPGGGT